MARKRKEDSAQLIRLKERIAQWRDQRGGRGGRIPRELWDAAIAVARRDGVFATAQAIGFNRGRLADRLARESGGGEDERGAAEDDGESGFVAVAVPRPDAAVVVDVIGRHGERMRVEGMRSADVCALIDRLWKLA